MKLAVTILFILTIIQGVSFGNSALPSDTQPTIPSRPTATHPQQPVSFRRARFIASLRTEACHSRRKGAGGAHFRFGRRLAIISTAVSVFFLSSGESLAQLCPRGGNAFGRVVAVDERLDLTLDDGTRLRIGSIDPARPTPANPDLDARGREILADWLVGQSIEFRPLDPQHDRWGRVIAMVFAPTGEMADRHSQVLLPVGEAIIDAGLARYAASMANDPCRGVLLAAEAQARASALGLWADPYYAVIAAGDRDSLAEKAGSMVIVEGRVAGLKVRKPVIMLYFAPRKGAEFAVTVLPRNGKAFAAAHTRLAGLTGQDVRIRGLVNTRFGPQIEISDLDALEVVSQGQSVAGSAE